MEKRERERKKAKKRAFLYMNFLSLALFLTCCFTRQVSILSIYPIYSSSSPLLFLLTIFHSSLLPTLSLSKFSLSLLLLFFIFFLFYLRNWAHSSVTLIDGLVDVACIAFN